MGNYRSRRGCLTCRSRRVKCDETHPICNACSRKNRPCQWEAPQNRFKNYQPDMTSTNSGASSCKDDIEDDAMEVDGSEGSQVSRAISPREQEKWRESRAESSLEAPSVSMSPSDQHSPASPFLTAPLRGQANGSVPVASLLKPQQTLQGMRPLSKEAIALTHDEAVLVHHYTEHLGRWLDCTDATRQFTLGVPEKVKKCPILCHAVLSFAARHRKDDVSAQSSYQRCIALLIDRLNEEAASHDETLLCAIVILRFYEQLNVPSNTGSDDENHLAGTSAILRASQGYHFVDPSAPTLREAAFWVYVRQCLYTATINQQPPAIDFSLQLHPTPGAMQDSHPLARLRLETAWANQMTWNLACVVNFCFDGSEPANERSHRARRWQELWDENQKWADERPKGFNPIWQGEPGENGPFPEIWFTADWHAMSFGFYHFACILLLAYKPGPKFAIRNLAGKSHTNLKILDHVRQLCGACKSSPETVPLSIAVCHTIFIWGLLVQDQQEREEVMQLLIGFEKEHVWPTTWIINALKQQWETT